MNPDPIHGQLRVEMEKMEKARRLLAGGTGKWYRSPHNAGWLTILALVVLGMIVLETSFETEMIILLAAVLGVLEHKMAIANKRIDKIVELTEAEKKLEEKYKANIRSIAECSRLASTHVNDKADGSTA